MGDLMSYRIENVGTRHTLYVGATDGISTRAQQHVLWSCIQTEYEGYTISNARGIWRGISEHCTRVEICTDNPGDLLSFVERLARRLRQECILVVSDSGPGTAGRSRLVYPEAD